MQVCPPCSKPETEGCRWAWPVCGLQITRPEFLTVAGAGAWGLGAPGFSQSFLTPPLQGCSSSPAQSGCSLEEWGAEDLYGPSPVGQRSKHWDTAGVGGHHGPWSLHWEPSAIRAKRHNMQGPERVPGAQDQILESKPRASHEPSQCRPALDDSLPNHHPP